MITAVGRLACRHQALDAFEKQVEPECEPSFAARYGRRMAALPPSAPELEETIEPRPSRTT
jgi:hypothetical protein